MTTIKIYDKDFTPLTTFVEADFTSLNWRKSKREIGDFSFVLRLDRAKVTDANLEMYNRIEVIESEEVDGEAVSSVVFNGVITRRVINIDTAEIRGMELTYVLKKRIVGAAYSVSGAIGTVASDLLDDINASDDTGIAIGDVSDAIGSVNTTFNQATAWDILLQVTKATGNDFVLNADRTLTISPTIGEDKSEDVILKYNVNQSAAANILSFKVEDDGTDIVTSINAKSNAHNSTRTDAGLSTKYGLLQSYKDFRVVNTLTVLEEFADAELRDRIYSPDLDLSPRVADNFVVGDIVRVVLLNALINIDESYQILEKRVQYNGDQKKISVRVNDLPNEIANKLSDRDRRLELLEKET